MAAGIAYGPTHTSHLADVAEIHTSDRALFRSCRRRWFFGSPLRLNLRQKEESILPLWVGSGGHAALEDYHGLNRFGHPTRAWLAYVDSFPVRQRPLGWEEESEIMQSILDYYADSWLTRRKEFTTLRIDGKPQVEVHFRIPIKGCDAFYVGTFDRVVKDPYNRLWVVDYKFMRKFIDQSKLDLDSQITSYTLSAQQLYGQEFEGVVFMQFIKALYGSPQELRSGALSRNKQQATTYSLYKKALMAKFGKIPAEYQPYLNQLLAGESIEGDAFIRYTLVRRNQHQIRAEAAKIRAEALDMTNPKLPLYPNPTMQCGWGCPFVDPCMAMDDGSDWRALLAEGYERRGDRPHWLGQFSEAASVAASTGADEAETDPLPWS